MRHREKRGGRLTALHDPVGSVAFRLRGNKAVEEGRDDVGRVDPLTVLLVGGFLHPAFGIDGITLFDIGRHPGRDFFIQNGNSDPFGVFAALALLIPPDILGSDRDLGGLAEALGILTDVTADDEEVGGAHVRIS